MTKIFDTWSDHPWLDALAAGALGGASGYFFPLLIDASAPLTRGETIDVFGAAGGIVAVLGGLGSVAVSSYAGGGGTRVGILRASHGKQLRRNLGGTLVATAASAILCWTGQLVAITQASCYAWIPVCIGVLWCLLTALRQLWLYTRLTELADEDANEQARPEAAAGSRWQSERTTGGGAPSPPPAGEGTLRL